MGANPLRCETSLVLGNPQSRHVSSALHERCCARCLRQSAKLLQSFEYGAKGPGKITGMCAAVFQNPRCSSYYMYFDMTVFNEP